MKKIKAIVLTTLILSLCAVLTLFGACSGMGGGGSETVYEPSQNQYDVTYQSQCTETCDDGVKIDGVLDDAIWQDKKWHKNTFVANLNDNMPILNVTGTLTDKGIYLATILQDTNLVYNGYFDPSKCTCIEYYLSAFSVNDERDDFLANRPHFYVDLGNNLYSTGMNMLHAVTVDGVVNSGETTSATIEIFIPWAQTGIDVTAGIPTEFYFLPNSRHVLYGTSGTKIIKGIQNFMQHPLNLYTFDVNGYTDADKEDAILGDAKNGYAKTGNWDVDDEDPSTVHIYDGAEYNSIFFTNSYGTYSIAETTLYPAGGNAKYTGHFGGFYYMTSEGFYYATSLNFSDAYLVRGANDTKSVNKHCIMTIDNFVSGWNQEMKYNVDNPSPEDDEGINFKIVKYEGTLHYFIDGEYVYSETLPFLLGNTFVGLYSLNMHMTYANCSYQELNETSARAYLEEQGIFRVTADIMSRGGNAVVSKEYVGEGMDVEISFTCDSGYVISEVKLNGVDVTEDVAINSSEGAYLISGVDEEKKLEVWFEKLENPVTYSGMVTLNGNPINAQLYFTNNQNQSLQYAVNASASSGFSIDLPAGKYNLATLRNGGKNLSLGLINVTEDSDAGVQIKDELNVVYGKASLYRNSAYQIQANTTSTIWSANKSFSVEATFRATQLDTTAGFYFEDANGVSFVLYLCQTENLRLHKGDNDWNVRMWQYIGQYGFKEGSMTHSIKALYNADWDKFFVYIDGELRATIPVTKIEAELGISLDLSSCKVGLGAYPDGATTIVRGLSFTDSEEELVEIFNTLKFFETANGITYNDGVYTFISKEATSKIFSANGSFSVSAVFDPMAWDSKVGFVLYDKNGVGLMIDGYNVDTLNVCWTGSNMHMGNNMVAYNLGIPYSESLTYKFEVRYDADTDSISVYINDVLKEQLTIAHIESIFLNTYADVLGSSVIDYDFSSCEIGLANHAWGVASGDTARDLVFTQN